MLDEFWDFNPLELGADKSAEKDTARVTKYNEYQAKEESGVNKRSNLWWIDKNCPSMMEVL